MRKNVARQPVPENDEGALRADPMFSAGRAVVDFGEAQVNEFSEQQNGAETNNLMTRYKIRHVTVDRYEYGRFRYSNLDDAVAQARRDEPAS